MMLRKSLTLILFCFVVVGFGAAEKTATAAAQTCETSQLSIPDLEKILSGMGYEATDWSNKNGFNVKTDASKKYNVQISFALSPDKRFVNIAVVVNNYEDGQFKNLKMDQLLAFNNAYTPQFNLFLRSEAPKYQLQLRVSEANRCITPKAILDDLNDLVSTLDNTDQIWNPTLWK